MSSLTPNAFECLLIFVCKWFCSNALTIYDDFMLTPIILMFNCPLPSGGQLKIRNWMRSIFIQINECLTRTRRARFQSQLRINEHIVYNIYLSSVFAIWSRSGVKKSQQIDHFKHDNLIWVFSFESSIDSWRLSRFQDFALCFRCDSHRSVNKMNCLRFSSRIRGEELFTIAMHRFTTNAWAECGSASTDIPVDESKTKTTRSLMQCLTHCCTWRTRNFMRPSHNSVRPKHGSDNCSKFPRFSSQISWILNTCFAYFIAFSLIHFNSSDRITRMNSHIATRFGLLRCTIHIDFQWNGVIMHFDLLFDSPPIFNWNLLKIRSRKHKIFRRCDEATAWYHRQQ